MQASPNREAVYYAILANDIEHPVKVMAQSILETGNYQCSSCSMDYNNLFGFRTSKGYIKFSNWRDSIRYYKIWQSKRLKQNEDYFVFLRRIGYATASNYEQATRKIYKQLLQKGFVRKDI